MARTKTHAFRHGFIVGMRTIVHAIRFRNAADRFNGFDDVDLMELLAHLSEEVKFTGESEKDIEHVKKQILELADIPEFFERSRKRPREAV